MNVYRQLAADYSELAFFNARKFVAYRGIAISRSSSKYLRKSCAGIARRYQANVIAYAEQVEHHLSEAYEMEHHLEDAAMADTMQVLRNNA